MTHKFQRVICLVLAMLMLALTGCTPTTPSTTGTSATTQPGTTAAPTQPSGDEEEYFLPKEEGCNQLTIYWDYDGDLTTASFWIWPEGGEGRGYLVYKCAYGVKVMVNIPKDVSSVGFIACYGCDNPGGTSWIGGTKDYDGDRYVDMNGDTTIYLKRGNPMIYHSEEEANAVQPSISSAGMTTLTTIKYYLHKPARITSLDQIKVMDGDRQIAITKVTSLNNKVNHGTITLAEPLDLSKTYTLSIEGFSPKTVVPTAVFDSAEFIANYTYDGDDLGAVIKDDGSTTFKVWAPTASKVMLNLFEAGNGGSAYSSLEMTKSEKGVWELNVPTTGHGTYYTYTVTTCVGTQEAVDPYAKAAGLNGDRGMVIDLNTTDPSGWEADQVVTLEKYTDATIWEIHVRDFSNNITGSKYPGKFLAFTERGLKNSSGMPIGVDYLLELGVTHIHLLPSYDYASVDEANPSFNWGYDPENYNVPEGSYSTDPYHGEVRIKEFKQMVQSLHSDGLGVILDVVYNHTYDANSNFNKIVPYYYYRLNADGTNTSASGCGNDTASERYMFRKFMVDSVSYWAKEYNLDGFRFDLMGLHDIDTMQAIEQAVHAINPDAIIYGEAWNMAGSTTDATMAIQSNLNMITTTEGASGAISAFNDAIRDGLKGSVFEQTGKGYINGNAGQNTLKIQFGIKGGQGTGVTWSVPNAAVINYMSAHDNNTLWDKLHLSNPDNTTEELLAMNRLGAAIIMISKGTPFWQAGEEFLRSKPNGDGTFNENSYNASDAVNNIRWDDITPDSDAYAMMRYYQGLIALRKEYAIFRSNSDDVTITFEGLPGGGLVAKFVASNGQQAIVLINPSATAVSYALEGSWNLVADGTRAGAAVLSQMTGEVTVNGCSVMIFVN